MTKFLCRFEGLTREGIPHGKGVMVIGNGTGGGLKKPSRGDRHVYSVNCLSPYAFSFADMSDCTADMKASFTQGLHMG